MPWIREISRLSRFEKEGLFRIIIPPSIFARFRIDPLSFCNEKGKKVVRFFCPRGDRTCLVEIKLPEMDDALYSLQLSDTEDSTQIEWDFLIANDPESPRSETGVDEEGRDTLFGWASRNIPEEIKAMEAGLFPAR